MFIIISVTITYVKKVMIIVEYKVKDLCTANRPMPCVTLKLIFLDSLLQIYVQVFQQFQQLLKNKMHLNNAIQKDVSFT